MQAEVKLEAGRHKGSLRLLSYNIQGGIETQAYHHYFIRSWQHLLPYRRKQENLDKIASVIKDYDIVALQETDAGSLRTNFMNQTEYLAKKAHFPFWFDQVNRNMGKLAQHSNSLLCKTNPHSVVEHKLPGLIPGRGALVVRFKIDGQELVVIVAHLALGKLARMRQLKFISKLINSEEHVILMGDLNCESDSAEMQYLLGETHLSKPQQYQDTFPSWQPKRNIDHILVSHGVEVIGVSVLPRGISDHLPVAMDIQLKNNSVNHQHE